MSKVYTITVIFALLLVALNLNGQGSGDNPDYYDLSDSSKKMVTNWDLTNPKFIEVTNQATQNYTTKIVDGAIELVCLADQGTKWGVNLSKLDSLCDWEIETKMKPDSKTFLDFLITIRERNVYQVNTVGLFQNNRVISAQTHIGKEAKHNDQDISELLNKDGSIIISIRKQNNQMMVFVNYLFAVSFPSEFNKVSPHRFDWVLPKKNQKLFIYSFKVYRISEG
jgi:hypothetical protein